jgi:VWFA-related protein
MCGCLRLCKKIFKNMPLLLVQYVKNKRNKRGNMKKKLAIIMISLCLSITQLAQDQPLKYNIYVNVKLLPVFALDSDGNPVFDLKKEEMELYVNGKAYKIAHFKRYDFESSTIEKREEKLEEHERVVFIILDTMFNSRTGFKRSKTIATDLVLSGKAGDRFIVFENSSFTGLKYVGGSDQSRDQLIKKIRKLRRPIERWATQLHNRREFSNNIDFSIITDARLETRAWESQRRFILASEKLRYKHQVQHFSRILSHLKYILKTISKPKLVFLISEGMARDAFKIEAKSWEDQDPEIITNQRQLISNELRSVQFQSLLTKDETHEFEKSQVYSPFLFRYLKEVVKSINYGGSVLHTINPRRLNDTNDEGRSGEMSLRYLAGESGGKYFAGSDAGEIVKRIKKTTSAYYEMAFYTDHEEGQNLNIQIKCKRKGIRVHTASYAEGSRCYREMDPIQKKMFALNVVSGGNWSRTLGKVMKVRYKKTKNGKNGNKNEYTLFIPLPNEMKNKKLDMFLIHLDTKTQQINMDIVNKEAKDWINLKIKPKKNKKQFFVLIEPSKTYCIYNKAL